MWSLTFFQFEVLIIFPAICAGVGACVRACARDHLTLLALWGVGLLFAQGALRFTPVTYDPVQE